MSGTREIAMALQKTSFHGLACVALVATLLAGCSTPPAYSVQQPAVARAGVVESIRSQTVQTANSAAGTIVGALAGGLLGNMVGGGTGRTVATVVGAVLVSQNGIQLLR
jgi:outer membrane lipoprotein SlyB